MATWVHAARCLAEVCAAAKGALIIDAAPTILAE